MAYSSSGTEKLLSPFLCLNYQFTPAWASNNQNTDAETVFCPSAKARNGTDEETTASGRQRLKKIRASNNNCPRVVVPALQLEITLTEKGQ